MKEVHYFYAPHGSNELPEDEAKHALRVLRLTDGSEMVVVDGEGLLHHAVVVTQGKKCFFEIRETLPQQPTWHGHLHLAVAPTKNIDRTEWLVEKATEIGFYSLTLLDCDFSERHHVNIERLGRILISAMKQSHKAFLPRLEGPVKLKDFLQRHMTAERFIAHCYNEPELTPEGRPFLFDALKDPQADAVVMIGPEGDFSVDEVRQALQVGYRSVSLGESRLRTETAALAAVHIMNIHHRTTTCNF